ncbi:MAG: hypothetical protein E2P05_07215 [Acidobacteria bacterium]|nr:MAG: hypothetical protein E2P05_07215 [Acidobacteriota bacterium]
MPVWDFQCSECGRKELDVHNVQFDPEPIWPECCGERMEMLFSTKVKPAFEPFTTNHIHPEGKPLTVRTQKELSKFQNEFGVQQVDDPNLISTGTKPHNQSFTQKDTSNRKYFDVGRGR